MGGNLAEWTDDYYRPPLRPTETYYCVDSGNTASDNSPYRILCGGRFRLGALSAMSTDYRVNAPEYISATTGFRIARTVSSE